MNKSLYILGRQPAIGLAELESLCGASNVTPVGTIAALVQRNSDAITPFERLGGAIKSGDVIASLQTTDWHDIQSHIASMLPTMLEKIPAGKIRFGISAYGFRITTDQINRTALTLKKSIRQSERSVRIVPNKYPDLSSAQTLHNKLTGSTGIELLIVRNTTSTLIARVDAVQDITNYAARDQKRPHRDAFVGMLPPKLAQIMINLAHPTAYNTILDPFCGTGVLLQEALLMNFSVYGTDWSERMVEYSDQNLAWLTERFHLPHAHYTIRQADATTTTWEFPFDTVVSETYLGTPLSGYPSDEKLREIITNVNVMHKKFLSNLRGQIRPGTRLCLAVPAWIDKHGRIIHLPSLDKLEEMGYNRVSFVHATQDDLVYRRPEQIVARELVILIRK